MDLERDIHESLILHRPQTFVSDGFKTFAELIPDETAITTATDLDSTTILAHIGSDDLATIQSYIPHL